MDSVESVLRAHPALFGELLNDPERFKFQVLVSEVRGGRVVRGSFRLDQEYFYPASTIKLCAAVAALQELKRLTTLLDIEVDCGTCLSFCSLSKEEHVEEDFKDKITVAEEIRKIFLVSDNRAFNRLYDFVGHRSLNQAMWQLGLRSTRIRHHLCNRPKANYHQDTTCRAVELHLGGGILAATLPKRSDLTMPGECTLQGTMIGKAYMGQNNELVDAPMDFSRKNRISLLDLQNLMIKIFRRDMELEGASLSLDEDSRLLLVESMAQYPGDSSMPEFNRSEYPDDYCKFFLPGLCRVKSKGSLRIYNKPGRAYGFTTDNAYIFDLETGRGFFLSATVYTNANGILNDDRYEYDMADRVLADLAEVICRAVWKIDPTVVTLSTPLDCTPSSLWPEKLEDSEIQLENGRAF